MEKSLHPGGLRRPNQISYESPAVVEEPVVEEEVTVFNPEEAAVEDNPFPETEETVDYESMTVPTLRELLAERGLIVSGIKAELIARLEEDDASLSEESETLGASEEAPSEEAAPSEEEVSQYGGTEEQ